MSDLGVPFMQLRMQYDSVIKAHSHSPQQSVDSAVDGCVSATRNFSISSLMQTTVSFLNGPLN